jgi:4a-hydroxytetrahydrobiopterin dehydratase
MKTDLTKMKCIPCEGGAPPLTQDQIDDLKQNIGSDWKIADSLKLKKEFFFDDFKHTMKFVNRVADLAEKEGHHPVLHVYYARVEIELWTHAIDGLSENDFIMAAKIDKV